MYTMRPAEFAYHRPLSLDEAISLLGDEDARPLAGGHSLLPLMKLRLATPGALVDLGRIPGLKEISANGGGLKIGALATHAAVAESEVAIGIAPVIPETAAKIGDRQVRNRGTIGGSVAHADPSADYPTVLKALGATINVAGKNGERQIAADDFFRGIFETALEPGELVTSVTVPATPAGTGAAYEKHSHPASRYAVVGVAAVVYARPWDVHLRAADRRRADGAAGARDGGRPGVDGRAGLAGCDCGRGREGARVDRERDRRRVRLGRVPHTSGNGARASRAHRGRLARRFVESLPGWGASSPNASTSCKAIATTAAAGWRAGRSRPSPRWRTSPRIRPPSCSSG